jgi:2'-5' RNA ligase
MGAERLFLSLPLPAPVRTSLLPLVEPAPGLAWSRPELWHVTLRFLGDVPEERLADLEHRLAEVRVGPFILPLAGAGSFPPHSPPRVLWIGTGAGHPRLFQLRQRIDDALLAAGLTVDLRTFLPHVTLARVSSELGLPVAERWVRAHRRAEGAPFRVEAFDLCASEPGPTGVFHTVKRRFPLAV